MDFYKKIISGLTRYEEDPPDSVWNKINRRIKLNKQLTRLRHTAVTVVFTCTVLGYFPIAEKGSVILLQTTVERPKTNKTFLNSIDTEDPETILENAPIRSEIRQADYKLPGLHSLTEPSNMAIEKMVTSQELTAHVHMPSISRIPLSMHSNVVDEDFTRKGIRKNKRSPRFYFLAMPTLGYNEFMPNKNDAVLIRSIDKLASLSLDRLGLRVEAGLQYPVTERISFSAGLLFLSRDQRFKINYNKVTPAVRLLSEDLDMAEVNAVSFRTYDSAVNYSIRNAGINVGINFKFQSKRNNHLVGSSLEFHKSVRGNDQNFIGHHNFYAFYNLFYRLEHPLSSTWSVVAQPSFNYAVMLSRTISTPLYVKPYEFGVSVGLIYHFK